MEQTIIRGSLKELGNILNRISCRKYLLVCDFGLKILSVREIIEKIPISYEVFSEFKPNPLYKDIQKGVAKFRETGCDAVVALGGGSAIDVAKCIKLFAKMQGSDYLTQPFCDSHVPLVAIPTTAGTGSEATHFAVIYVNGQKQSVAHEGLIPNYAILDASLLRTLPLYQKKCTMLDALCHGIEAWWSVNSTDESKEYSKIAIQKIIENKDEYLNGNPQAAEQIMLASNFAGKAINITKTTAAHAMSYKLTTLYGLPHGHAVALCLPRLWEYMNENLHKCLDPRGADYVKHVFEEIACALGAKSAEEAIIGFDAMLDSMDIQSPECNSEDLEILSTSVNAERLKNNPISVSQADFYELYQNALKCC